jgi:acetate kinase
MKILVINCGSSSIKYRLFDIHGNGDNLELAKGLIERVGTNQAQVVHQTGEQKCSAEKSIPDYVSGIKDIALHLSTDKLINDDLVAVGHRVVHGAEEFRESVIIDKSVVDQIARCSQLAPLHNPANLSGIKACQEIFPNIPQIAVFDTAFFQTLTPDAFLYALPYEWYEKYRVRRYGFHGTSHRYVAEQAAKLLDKPLSQLNLITMHLGNGCSMAAIRQGTAVNTTMGLTPLEGLVMGSRCGDIDTAIVFHMLAVSGMNIDQVRNALEKNSGLYGISGVSRDMRDVFEAADQGNERAKMAVKIFAARVKKYIGSFMTDTGKPNAIIFTGGIGENAWRMRELITSGLEHLGIKLDTGKNSSLKLPLAGAPIHTPDSSIQILVIPTNEELAIARDACKLVAK